MHVSTAYVAGRRRGAIPEGPVDHTVDVDAETEWGMAQRRVVEHASRSADVLARLRARAERRHGRAGLLTAAAAAEADRRDWVNRELVRVGTERARSLGWTDCYTFTKALGERVVEERARTAPTTIVRPSIIESSLRRPHPGWIEGFKMAEPLILAYGRGELPEFPAAGDTIVDIVPVDHVVAAIVAILASPPTPGAAAYFHVVSGARNPLTFRQLYATVRAYFDEHPFTNGDRGSARLPEWRFPGAQSVERLLTTSERAHKVADYVIGHAPRSARTLSLARDLDRQGRRLEFLRRYLNLYREYAEAELRFDDAHTRALLDDLHPDDRATFGFDIDDVDWDHYLREVHCPAVTAPIRELDEVRRGRARSATATLRPVKQAEQRIAAFFDMDGTLLSSNVIETYLWMRLQELSPAERLGELGRIAARLPGLVRAERRERSAFLRSIYREYAGARLSDLDAVVDEVLTDHVLSRLAPGAVRRIREHRAAGHTTILITGAIRPLTRPIAPLFDHIEAADLAADDRGICTGFLAASPLVGESRAAWMRHWAADRGHRPVEELRLRRQPLRPPPARGGGPAGGGQPRRVAGEARPAPALDDRRLGEPRRRVPPPQPRGGTPMMLALQMYRSLPRHLAGRAVGDRLPGILSGYAAPLRLVTIDEPSVDRPGWARLRTRLSGVCGSDLGALSGRTSRYFSGLVSMPFVPGHEVVADLLDDCDDLPAGTRVVIDPVLTCEARGVEPCDALCRGAHQPLQPDHRRSSLPRAPDRLLCRHRRRLGRDPHRPPQPAPPGARGPLRRAGDPDRADRLRGAHRAAGRGRGQRAGAGERRRLGRPADDAGPAQPDRGR